MSPNKMKYRIKQLEASYEELHYDLCKAYNRLVTLERTVESLVERLDRPDVKQRKEKLS